MVKKKMIRKIKMKKRASPAVPGSNLISVSEGAGESQGKKKRLKGLSELIALGKEKGHLTFEEVNNILPVDIVSSEEIDEILGILGDENIKLIDSEEELTKEGVEEERAEDGQRFRELHNQRQALRPDKEAEGALPVSPAHNRGRQL